MVQEVIVSAILIIASVIAVVAFVDAVIPSVYDLSNSYNSLANNMEDHFKTAIEIVFTYPEGNNVTVWIKNIGSTNIPLSELNHCDFYVLSSSSYWNPVLGSNSTPSWNYTLVNGNGSTWNHGQTIQASMNFNTLPSNSIIRSNFPYTMECQLRIYSQHDNY
jgi:archaeal flagellar protein FlaG